ncbi:MAG TPA: hypothetical protein VKA22_03645 [Desulfuromonadales bacterium]|nr:hypothetical protein [Desulfuromonadales bacterium]
MKTHLRRTITFAICVLALCANVVSAAKVEKFFDRAGNLIVQEKVEKYKRRADEGETYPVPPPPFSEDIFPCSECHAEMEPNPERRELVDMHDDIILDHAEGQRWCLDCHNLNDRDTLRLVSGEVIPFTESYRLCGQCHGDKFRDWKVGIHGKRTGYWNGEKQYLLCAHCHNPHSPRFKPLKPMPPPVRPENLNRQGALEETGHQ